MGTDRQQGSQLPPPGDPPPPCPSEDPPRRLGRELRSQVIRLRAPLDLITSRTPGHLLSSFTIREGNGALRE